MSKKQPAIPLKDVMLAIDKRDKNFYNNLSPEQKKAFSTWMMMRYTSSVQGKDAAHYIFMTNELVNKDFTEVSKHPELQWLLLKACGIGKIQYHPYIKPPNSKKKKDKIHTFINELYPDLNTDEISLLLNINSTEDFKELARANGYADKDIADIFGK